MRLVLVLGGGNESPVAAVTQPARLAASGSSGGSAAAASWQRGRRVCRGHGGLQRLRQPVRGLRAAEGPLVQHQQGKQIWHERCIFLAKKCKQVGGKAGHPEFIFANRTDLKSVTRGLPNPTSFSTAAWSLSVLPRCGRPFPVRRMPCLFERARGTGCYGLDNAQVQFSASTGLGYLI